jgi:hypothetical protein
MKGQNNIVGRQNDLMKCRFRPEMRQNLENGGSG